MSVLNKREFLAAALGGALAGLGTSIAGTLTAEPETRRDLEEKPQQATNLENHLLEKHPDISPAIIKEIAFDYDPINKNHWVRSYINAAVGGAAYAWADEEPGGSLFFKMIMASFVSGPISDIGGGLVSECPESEILQREIESKYKALKPEQASEITGTLEEYLKNRLSPYSEGVALASMMVKPYAEEWLDEHDINTQSNEPDSP